MNRAGGIVVELLWLRAALQWFLITFAVVVTGSVLAAGAGRRALLAGGAKLYDYPLANILIYGGICLQGGAQPVSSQRRSPSPPHLLEAWSQP